MKQFVYGACYLVIFALIGYWIYFVYFKPVPSCTDHIQNQSEEGVDCGDICGRICLPSDLHAVEVVGSSRLFQPDTEHTALLGQIANRNSTLAARQVGYIFTLKTAAGQSVNVPGETYLYSDESKYIIAFFQPKDYGLGATSTASTTVSLTVTQPSWIKASSFPRVTVQVQNVVTDVRATGIHIFGRIKNEGAARLRPVTVIALLKNDAGEVIGATGTLKDELGPSETSDFDLIYPALLGVNPALTDVYAYALRP